MSKTKLVPIEPTREMWAAGGDAVLSCGQVHHDKIVDAVWHNMLRVAPAGEHPPIEPTDAMVDAAELKMPQLGRLQIRFLYETMVAARDQSSISETKP